MFPITSKKLTTKQIILQVASDLFMDKGYLSTSTRMIAEAVGITQPNLYHYFKTKEEIYVAVLEDLGAVVKKDLNQIVMSKQGTLEKKLIEILHYLRDKHPVNLNIMLHDINNEISSDSRYALYTIWKNSYVAPLVYLFEQYIGEQSTFKAEDLARHYYSTIAPYIQKEAKRFEGLNYDQVIHLFVYGILDENGQ